MNVWMEDNASRYPNFLNSLKFIEHKALLFYFHLLKKKKVTQVKRLMKYLEFR